MAVPAKKNTYVIETNKSLSAIKDALPCAKVKKMPDLGKPPQKGASTAPPGF